MRVPAFIRQAQQLPGVLLVAICVAMALLITLGALSYHNIKRQADAARWVAHTAQVDVVLKDIYANVQDAESGQRMFTVSGVERYLEPCLAAIKKLPGDLEQARDLMGDNTVQIARLQTLHMDIDRRLALINTRIAQRRQQGTRALDPAVVNGEGVELMGRVRADLGVMAADEDRLLATRLDGLQRARKRALWVQNVTGVISLALLAGVFITLAKQMLRAMRAEQEAQRSNTQLRDANNEMRSFSYSVAHDLRSPLRAINGLAQKLVDECAGQLGDESRQALTRITANATTMAQLIDDLLALSKISYQPLRAAKIDMTELARDAYQELRSEPQNGQVVDCVINELPPAAGDPLLLRQVWLNLIGNALKFSSMRNKVEIEIGGNVAGPEFATYYIRDNGAGFDMKHAAKLFGAFQRLHEPGEFEGTGIGLALVQRIVQRHGGTIWAEGNENAGARFAFTLPEWGEGSGDES
jgi:signal transduction histidine kinase